MQNSLKHEEAVASSFIENTYKAVFDQNFSKISAAFNEYSYQNLINPTLSSEETGKVNYYQTYNATTEISKSPDFDLTNSYENASCENFYISKNFVYNQKNNNNIYSKNENLNNNFQNSSEGEFTKKHLNKLDNIPFNHIETSFNIQGNYQNYISRVIRSLTPLLNIDFSNHIQERLVLLPEYNKKKTLILDLDETLIHADFEERFIEHDETINFIYEGEEVSVKINLRPGVFDFLNKVSEFFEIFIFTASKKEYADAVLDYLDPERRIIKHRLYRDSCIAINNKVYLKDLSIFVNRKPENIILVDNSFYSFCNQPKNGVLINSFYNDTQDTELNNLLNYLQNYLLHSHDVREVNEEIFNFANMIEQTKNNKKE